MLTFTAYYSSSAGNLYKLESSKGGTLLLEAGVNISKIKQALNFRLSEVDALLVTHQHLDHSAASMSVMDCGIPGFMSRGTAESLGLIDHHGIMIVRDSQQFIIGPFSIVPFDVEHEADEPLGFLISDGEDKLLFCTDTHFIRPRFRGLTMVAIECNWSEETLSTDTEPVVKQYLTRNHMSLAAVKSFLGANDLGNVREIHLLHISSTNGDEKYFCSEVARATGIPVFAAQEKPLQKPRAPVEGKGKRKTK